MCSGISLSHFSFKKIRKNRKLKMKKKIALTVLLISPLSIANSMSLPDLRTCTAIKNDIERLTCFDQVMTNLPLTETEHVDSTSAPLILIPRPSKGDAALVSSEKSKLPTSTDANFGMETKILQKKRSQVDSISAQVDSIEESARGNKTLTLNNQQRWEQAESRPFRIKVGDTVIILRSAMGSFRIKKQGTNRTIRVRRIES
jgi:hypothetical protein